MPYDASQIKHYPRSQQPWVRLVFNPDSRGRLVSEGPEQSTVRWTNGNENSVLNSWIERIGGEGPGPSPFAAKDHTSPSAGNLPDKRPEPAPTKPTRKAPPDDLPERLKEFGLSELKNFAQRNGVWDERYIVLPNFGLIKMNCINKLRAKIKKGHAVIWK